MAKESATSDIAKILNDLGGFKDLLFLVDLSNISSYDDTTARYIRCALGYARGKFMTVVAHSSGGGDFINPQDKPFRIVIANILEYNKVVNFLPFTKNEVEIFLEKLPSELNVNVLVNLTNCNPSLMSSLRLYPDEVSATVLLQKKVRHHIVSILPAVKETGFDWIIRNLPICKKYLFYACNDWNIPEHDRLDYYRSWLHSEMLTYVCWSDGEHFKLKLNFPTIEVELMAVLRKHCEANLQYGGISSPIVKGLYFEKAICERMRTLEVIYDKDEAIMNAVTFDIGMFLSVGKALSEINVGVLYHLREFHPVIDAIGSFVHEGQHWLVMIQVSLSKYSDHKSKAADLFKKTSGSEEVVGPGITLLEYYKNRVSGVTADNLKCMYVYICPTQFYTQGGTSPRAVLGDIGIRDNTKNIYFGLVQESTHTCKFITDQLVELSG